MKLLTLAEKSQGPGFREMGAPVKRDLSVCAVLDCPDPVAGTCELMVDDKPTGRDWYSRLLASLPTAIYTRLAFCRGHLYEVGALSVDAQDEPDQWAPNRENPFILTRPPKLFT